MKDLYLIGAAPGWLIGLISLGAAAPAGTAVFRLKRSGCRSAKRLFSSSCAPVYAVLLSFCSARPLIDKRVS